MITDRGMPRQGDNNNQDAIKVMLVDDSAVIRGALTRLLEEDPAIEIISSVTNGEVAIGSAERHKPDIVILDIEMPVMDGITALPQILKRSPNSKVIMFSTLTEKGAQVTIKALALGAVECLVKPGPGEAKSGGDFQQNLIKLIKNLCPRSRRASGPAGISGAANPSPSSGSSQAQHITPQAALAKTAAQSTKPRNSVSLRSSAGLYTGKPAILAIGSSTGGPQALFQVLKNCNGFNIPIVITQHMPATFTKILAQHITQQTGLSAQEGENGMVVENGKVYVAPGGFHMLFETGSNQQMRIKLDDGAPVNYCKPAVDPMFESLIKIYGNKVLGVILTGMGHDGLGGGKTLSEMGGRLIAQDEQTSVVWGMPGAVATAGICTAVLPLDEIGPWIKKAVSG